MVRPYAILTVHYPSGRPVALPLPIAPISQPFPSQPSPHPIFPCIAYQSSTALASASCYSNPCSPHVLLPLPIATAPRRHPPSHPSLLSQPSPFSHLAASSAVSLLLSSPMYASPRLFVASPLLARALSPLASRCLYSPLMCCPVPTIPPLYTFAPRPLLSACAVLCFPYPILLPSTPRPSPFHSPSFSLPLPALLPSTPRPSPFHSPPFSLPLPALLPSTPRPSPFHSPPFSLPLPALLPSTPRPSPFHSPPFSLPLPALLPSTPRPSPFHSPPFSLPLPALLPSTPRPSPFHSPFSFLPPFSLPLSSHDSPPLFPPRLTSQLACLKHAK
ncbi:unnamed protein product [Closterium sp. Naga37s-1]|nr:unnamed protein product [Closterium sp. Naga37s-1]